MGLSKYEQQEYDEKGIKKINLKDGAYYKGHCRNASIARWNKKTNQFYYNRTKFGSTFVESLPGPEEAIDGLDYFMPETEELNPTIIIEIIKDET